MVASSEASFYTGTSSDMSLSASTAITIAGTLEAKGAIIDCQDLVIETTGLITAEGTSNLFATTRMRSAYESFLADVATVHDASTNIYQEVRRLAFSVLMRGDPADTRSVKEASEDLHNMVSLDTQFPVAFDALFLTSTVDDFLETRPCKEIEAGTPSNPGDGRAARLSPVVTRDCFVCIYHNTPFLGDGKGTVATDAAKRAEGITSMQQMCTDSCPAINRNEVYADFEKNAIAFKSLYKF